MKLRAAADFWARRSVEEGAYPSRTYRDNRRATKPRTKRRAERSFTFISWVLSKSENRTPESRSKSRRTKSENEMILLFRVSDSLRNSGIRISDLERA